MSSVAAHPCETDKSNIDSSHQYHRRRDHGRSFAEQHCIGTNEVESLDQRVIEPTRDHSTWSRKESSRSRSFRERRGEPLDRASRFPCCPTGQRPAPRSI